MKYFDEVYRKECRKMIVNYIYDYFDKTKYPNNILAFMIKSFHFTFGYISIFIIIFANLWIGIAIVVILLIYGGLYFKGCIISHLEYKLCKTDFINIIDPYLISMNYDLTNNNRYIVTSKLIKIYFMVTLPILYYRFNNIKN